MIPLHLPIYVDFRVNELIMSPYVLQNGRLFLEPFQDHLQKNYTPIYF